MPIINISGSFLPSLGRQQPKSTRVEGASIVMKSSAAGAIFDQFPLVPLRDLTYRELLQLPPLRRHSFSARLMPLEVTAVGAASHIVQVIRFATFEVDFRAGEVRKGGLKLKLTG